jgi:hypothetical protein
VDNTKEPHESESQTPAYDWTSVQRLFAMKPRGLEFFAIDFSPTTEVDRQQLPVPRPSPHLPNLYTAAFFCRDAEHWFIYRVIFALPRKVKLPKERRAIFKNLEQGAYFAIAHHKRTKDPLKYLKEIDIFRG